MARRAGDAWRDQAGHDEGRTDASGPDMWVDEQPTSADETITIGMLDRCPFRGCAREGQTHDHRRYDLLRDQFVAGEGITVSEARFSRPTRAEYISAMSRVELERASEKFGPLNSTHQGWAVILEEIEEANEEINLLCAAHSAMWTATRGDGADTARASAELIIYRAERAAAELIQVAAMGRRFVRDIRAGDEPTGPSDILRESDRVRAAREDENAGNPPVF